MKTETEEKLRKNWYRKVMSKSPRVGCDAKREAMFLALSALRRSIRENWEIRGPKEAEWNLRDILRENIAALRVLEKITYGAY